jgi:hypothetical protein
LLVRVFTSATAALGVLALANAGALGAQNYEPNHLRDTYDFTVSGANVILSSDLQSDGDSRPGTQINGESVLGLSKNKFQPRFAFTWRPGSRHELELGYLFVRRDASNTVNKDFTFRDSTYQVGRRIDSRFNSDQLFLNYRFAFWNREKSQVGMGVGVGALFLDIGISALAAGNSNSVQFIRGRTYTAPTGTIGGFGKWAFGSKSIVLADLRAIKVNVSDLDATIYEGGASYRYYFVPKFGGELGYGGSSYHLNLTQKNDGGGDMKTDLKYTLQNFRFGLVIVM